MIGILEKELELNEESNKNPIVFRLSFVKNQIFVHPTKIYVCRMRFNAVQWQQQRWRQHSTAHYFTMRWARDYCTAYLPAEEKRRVRERESERSKQQIYSVSFFQFIFKVVLAAACTWNAISCQNANVHEKSKMLKTITTQRLWVCRELSVISLQALCVAAALANTRTHAQFQWDKVSLQK